MERKQYRRKTAQAFAAGFKFLQETRDVFDLATRGISVLQGLGNLSEAIAHLDELDGKTGSVERLEEDRKLAELASQEVAADFPLLRAHTVVALWSILETVIPNFAAAWLTEFPETLQRPEFQRLRVPIDVLSEQDEERRMAAIIAELLEKREASLKPGVGKFQVVLDALGLGFGISDELRRNLFELSQVRNVIVHRISIVDARFVRECPWFNIRVGDRLKISHDMYDRYWNTVMEYLTDIVNKARENTPKPTLAKLDPEPPEGVA